MARPVFYLEYGADKRLLADWGLENPHRRRVSQAASTFTVDQPTADIEDDPLFAFEGIVKIWRDSKVFFQGCLVNAPADGRPEYEGLSYEFHDPWYYLETTIFQQAHRIKQNDGSFRNIYVGETWLFTKLGTDSIEPQSTKDQIIEILTWAISTGAQLQIGTIDVDLAVPSYYIRERSCAEALRYCMQLAPDANTVFDYSTTPPTLHFRRRGNLAPIAMPYADGTEHKAVKITPRPELQVPCVALKFKLTHTIDGVDYIQPMDVPPCLQVYPPGATGAERRALVQTIDLLGVGITTVKGKLTTIPLAANSADFATRLAWWVLHHKQLGDHRLTGMIIEIGSVVDLAGNAIDLSTYKYELRPNGGQIAPWMKLKSNGNQVLSIEAVVSAKISYDQKDDDAQPLHNITRVFSTQVTLTNSPSDTYTAIDSETTAEPIPVGMAQSIYQALQERQYDVEYVHNGAQGEVGDVFGMDNVLNIAGGRAEWQTMKALPQSIDEDLETGETRITCGPVRHLDAGDMTALFMMFRYRLTIKNPDTRQSGKTGSGGDVQLADQAVSKQDTGHNLDEYALHSVAHKDNSVGQKMMLVQDAPNRLFSMAVLDDAGHELVSPGLIKMLLSDCLGKEIRIRPMTVYDINCRPMTQLFLCSEPFDS